MEPTKTILEFCATEGISRATYYNLKRDGLAPREMRIRGSVRITPEAHADWRRRMEGQTSEGRAA